MESYQIRKVLADNIKIYRFNLGYTQEQLAEKCDISTRYLSDIENSKGNISIDTLEELSKALKVEAYQLLRPRKKIDLPKRVNMK